MLHQVRIISPSMFTINRRPMMAEKKLKSGQTIPEMNMIGMPATSPRVGPPAVIKQRMPYKQKKSSPRTRPMLPIKQKATVYKRY